MNMKIAFNCIIFLLAMFLGAVSYQQGWKNAEKKWFGEGLFTGQMWLENPPTILNNCRSICQDSESVSWEEYVRRYHESKMRLDQPGGGE